MQPYGAYAPGVWMRRKPCGGNCLSTALLCSVQEETCVPLRTIKCILFIDCLLLMYMWLFCLFRKNEVNIVVCLVMDCRTLITAGI